MQFSVAFTKHSYVTFREPWGVCSGRWSKGPRIGLRNAVSGRRARTSGPFGRPHNLPRCVILSGNGLKEVPTPEVHYRAGSDDSGIKWLIAACVVIVAVVGIALLSPRARQERPSRASTTAPSGEIRACPIKKIHPGMLLQDVRHQLAGYAMDYRGLRQDENVYYVDAGVCHALLDFSYSDNGLDSIDYGEGFNKIEFRDRAQAPNNTDRAAASPSSTATKEHTVDTSSSSKSESPKGFPVPEDVFINAYVVANRGQEDFDDEQLRQLGQQEYRLAQSVSTTMILLLPSARAKRTLDLLEKVYKLKSGGAEPKP